MPNRPPPPFIGPENASPQPGVKLSGSWTKMAYQVTLSLHIIDTHTLYSGGDKRAFGSICACADTLGRFSHRCRLTRCCSLLRFGANLAVLFPYVKHLFLNES